VENGTGGGATARHRCLFRFSVDGDLRFISHHDTLRLLRRALARADLPVRFSEGFNPHPRMSLPWPRPVGVASDDEALVVEFERAIDRDEALLRLNAQMPRGVRVLDARQLEEGEHVRPELLRYRLDLNGEADEGLADRARSLLEAEKLPVQRIDAAGGQAKTVDIRPYLVDLAVHENRLEFTVRVMGTGSARPAELTRLLSLEPSAVNHRIRRIAVEWK
jgi:radical SAM-linked protein